MSLCLDIRSVDSGALNVKRTSIPLAAESLRVRGGVDLFTSSSQIFRPRTDGDALTSTANPIPGGLVGIALPLPGNTVNASFELAGDPSAINFDIDNFGLSLPVKIRLANRYIGANCHIGTDADPINLRLHADPIGDYTYDEVTGIVIFSDTVELDGAFAVPGASGCGYYPQGTLVNRLINYRLGLPSASGQNSITLPVQIAYVDRSVIS